jgi:hypothetical protein
MFSRVWVLLVLLLPCAATQAQETSMVPVIVDGETVRLEMRITELNPSAAPAKVRLDYEVVG